MSKEPYELPKEVVEMFEQLARWYDNDPPECGVLSIDDFQYQIHVYYANKIKEYANKIKEARVDELKTLQLFHEDLNNDFGEQQCFDTSQYLDERIEELSKPVDN